jgi:hypothetical protein
LNTNDNLQAFGVFVQIYHNTHKGDLFSIDKFHNFITLGDQVYDDSAKTLQFETITLILGNVEVSNVTGLKLTNIKDEISTSLVNRKDDISFMIDCMNPFTYDIVIPKGLRMNYLPAELIIQKPGEADGGPNKIVIPYQTDLTNLGYRLTTLENGCGSGSGGESGGNPEYLIDEITGSQTSSQKIDFQ